MLKVFQVVLAGFANGRLGNCRVVHRSLIEVRVQQEWLIFKRNKFSLFLPFWRRNSVYQWQFNLALLIKITFLFLHTFGYPFRSGIIFCIGRFLMKVICRKLFCNRAPVWSFLDFSWLLFLKFWTESAITDLLDLLKIIHLRFGFLCRLPRAIHLVGFVSSWPEQHFIRRKSHTRFY